MLIAHSLSQPVLVWFSADLTLPVRQCSIYSGPNLQYIQSNTITQTVNSSSLSEECCHSLSSLHCSADLRRRSDAVHRLTTTMLFKKFLSITLLNLIFTFVKKETLMLVANDNIKVINRKYIFLLPYKLKIFISCMYALIPTFQLWHQVIFGRNTYT